jgi:hypothetical protein
VHLILLVVILNYLNQLLKKELETIAGLYKNDQDERKLVNLIGNGYENKRLDK